MARSHGIVFQCEAEARDQLRIEDRGTDPGRPAIEVIGVFQVELIGNSRRCAPLSDNSITAADEGIAHEWRVVDGTANPTDAAHSSNAAYTPDAAYAANPTHASDTAYATHSANPAEGSDPC
ncbi:hypothetical protein JH26_17045 [Microvirga sp. BSC39]|nr:hypothetical protein JH26_17045 [Microvirga sp. BSC39]